MSWDLRSVERRIAPLVPYARRAAEDPHTRSQLQAGALSARSAVKRGAAVGFQHGISDAKVRQDLIDAGSSLQGALVRIRDTDTGGRKVRPVLALGAVAGLAAYALSKLRG